MPFPLINIIKEKEGYVLRHLLISIVALLVVTQICWASPTGLNNISTADVVPEKVLVLQSYSDFGEDNKPDHFIGFKYGLIKNLEVGLDGRIFPEADLEEWVKGQIKYRFEFNETTAVSAGVANLGDRARLGWEDYYLVFTHNFGFLRAHLGGTVQRDNEGGFAGLDKTFKLFDRDFTLRTDIIETNDSHDITNSVGFMYDLGNNIIFESWVSFPGQSGKENVSTIKLNYVIKF